MSMREAATRGFPGGLENARVIDEYTLDEPDLLDQFPCVGAFPELKGGSSDRKDAFTGLLEPAF